MTQQNPRELLKQGDPQAIASSINRTLKPKGINAEVTRDNGCLHIFLESAKVPDQMVLVDFIRTGMTKLGLESIHTVKVYGIETGQDSPAWQDEIELIPTSPMLYEDETSMPNDSVGLDDVESEAGDYYQDEDFDGDNENDDDEEDDEEEETPPPKKQFPKWVIPVGILVPVLALAGLFFTKSPPFSSDSASEPSPPVVIKPSSKATSGASNKGKPSPSTAAATPSATASAAPNAATKPASPVPAATSPAPKPASPAASAATPKLDNWRVAVNQAQKAAILAQTAQSQTEWNAVAADWQKAVQLMNSVPTTSPNHQKAQQKAAEYKLNLEVANRRAAAAP